MKYDFRLDILRNKVKVGEALAESVTIHYDYNSSVQKGIQFDMKKIQMSSDLKFDMFQDRIRPVLIKNGMESSLGIYMIMAAPRTMSEVTDYYSIEGYDETMIIKQSAFDTRQYYPAETPYTTIVQQLLVSLGFATMSVTPSDHVLAEDLEVAAGKNHLEFINSMLDAINYQHVYADSNGTLIVRPISDPSTPDFIYRGSQAFNIIPPIHVTTDIYDLPNVVVGVYSSPESDAPIVYKKVNDDPLSQISTVRRGYKVVKQINVWNIADQAEMETLITREAFEAMQATEQVAFSSIAESGHEPNTALQLDTDLVSGLFIEKRWEMNISQGSFNMKHTAERKVYV